MDEEREEEFFGKVRKALDIGDAGRAEKLLYEIEERNAEWYYLQSLVFREKMWFSESRKSIKKAIKLEPKNKEYRTALKELEQKAKENRKKERAEQKERERHAQQMGATDKADAALCQAICEGLCDGCNGC
ncbi:MAG: hypothetical protein K2G44_02520 [Clostridia bacterium]|nr:hypothetical protein [Clostridia bacterium]